MGLLEGMEDVVEDGSGAGIGLGFGVIRDGCGLEG